MIERSFTLNKIQKLFLLNAQGCHKTVSLWGRGTGKSFEMALLIHLIVKYLPRSKWLIVGESFKSMTFNTLPGTLNALEIFGYYRDIQFVIGAPPKDGWGRPYEEPLKTYAHCLTFWNGTMFQLVSQDSSSSSPRGLNTDGVLGDEALRLDKNKYDEEVSPTLRANRFNPVFQGVPFHHGEFFFSSMPYGTEGDWLLEIGKYYEEQGIDLELLRNKLIDLQIEFLKTSSMNLRRELWKEITEFEKQIQFYPHQGVYYSESNAFDNIKVLGINYLEKHFRSMTEISFLIEIMNKRMRKIDGGFYAKLERAKHCYKGHYNLDGELHNNALIEELVGEQYRVDKIDTSKHEHSLLDRDCNPNKPLILGADWGGKINCLWVAQEVEGQNMLVFLKTFYALSPEILDKVYEDFCQYYRFHQDKTVFFYYDRNGNTKVANSQMSYGEQATQVMMKQKWTVIGMTNGLDGPHMKRYLLANMILAEEQAHLPKFRFNLANCKDGIIAMEATPVKDGRNGVEKDKSAERGELTQQVHAPHFSDAWDAIVYQKYEYLLQEYSSVFIGSQVR